MIPRNTEKVALFLLRNINELGYNINQISRLNNISVGSAFKILKELEKDKILLKKEINNASHYKLNLDNHETAKLCELLLLGEKRKLKGYARVYADEIMKFEQADFIILFGSILKGKDFNDVDALFTTNQVRKVTDFCLEISKVRTKPVVPLILKKEDFIRELKQKKEPILDIVKNGVIIKGEGEFMEAIKSVNS